MKKVLLFLVISLSFMGCGLRSHGPYNEVVNVPLEEGHTITVNFHKKHGIITANVFVWREGYSSIRSRYLGSVKFINRNIDYTFYLEQNFLNDDLNKKQRKYYEENGPISMDVIYHSKSKTYDICFHDSQCPILNMSSPRKLQSDRILGKEAKKRDKDRSFIEKSVDWLVYYYESGSDYINNAFDTVFRSWSFKSHWWFLFYLGGLLIIAIGLKVFTPLVWIGIIMEYAYLHFMAQPFYMLWPSVVGWGWMLLSVIPIVLLVSLNLMLCISIVISTFKDIGALIILLIPAFIAIMSIFTIIDIAFTDHLELVIFFILGASGSSYTLIGTFTDGSGNVWDVYLK